MGTEGEPHEDDDGTSSEDMSNEKNPGWLGFIGMKYCPVMCGLYIYNNRYTDPY